VQIAALVKKIRNNLLRQKVGDFVSVRLAPGNKQLKSSVGDCWNIDSLPMAAGSKTKAATSAMRRNKIWRYVL
jgi:hypothetical protein